ncbi:metallophosphoesterase family protein [Micromonospora sp. RL09-050-HVF-A]|uniref:metallophosphoesterase family protein n=1 Tax=Micromonospora sp. RL09-050-HVF-A TaxID=1703433 RepID=UPI0027E2B0CC|nr:metallophosphoesterase family protein [Micromonospora sp. RL09-050-HVF-A]
MLERVAVLSDVHGALPALEAVLAEPEVAAADLIVVTGDVAAGPQPVEVLDLLTGLGARVRWVRGNADRELVQARAGRPSEHDVSNWAAEQLRADQVVLLAALPLTLTLPVAGLGPVLFCHATPRDDEEVVLVDSRPARWAEVFAGLPPEVRTVVCGHTHMPFTRLVDRRLVINPGSVGMPYGGPGRTGHCSVRGCSCAVRDSTSTRPVPGSPPGRAIRTPPPGRTSTCAPGTATSTRSPPSPRATAADRRPAPERTDGTGRGHHGA